MLQKVKLHNGVEMPMEGFGIYEPMMALLTHPFKTLKQQFKMFIPLIIGWILGFAVIIPFLIGLAGIALLFARLVTMLFRKHYAVISRVILGFVIASSLKIIPNNFVLAIEIIISIVCFVAGFIVSRLMDKAKTKENCSKEN